MDRSMIDAASGGALIDKTLAATRKLISNMARASQPRMVNEIGTVDNLRLENQLELTSLVRQLAVGQHQPSIAARVYDTCTFVEPPIDMCPTLQETESNYLKSVGAIGGLSLGPYAAQRFGPAPNAPQGTAGATVPTTTIIENASSRQFTISGGPNEAISKKQSRVSTNHEL
ncbi:hypothetical protein CR513_10664, partial [Mucuna pruriens]